MLPAGEIWSVVMESPKFSNTCASLMPVSDGNSFVYADTHTQAYICTNKQTPRDLIFPDSTLLLQRWLCALECHFGVPSSISELFLTSQSATAAVTVNRTKTRLLSTNHRCTSQGGWLGQNHYFGGKSYIFRTEAISQKWKKISFLYLFIAFSKIQCPKSGFLLIIIARGKSGKAILQVGSFSSAVRRNIFLAKTAEPP